MKETEINQNIDWLKYQKELTEILEVDGVDRLGIAGVLDLLSEICYEKADHLQSNWQDSKAAKEWSKLAAKIDRFANKVR